MAEIKNTFIKAKMNKDLDDRLVPTGEYRNAQNISISRSEGSDVGALENILGNTILNNQEDLDIDNLDVIGFLADDATNYIYLFLSDYVDSSDSGIANFAPVGSNCIIARYNTLKSENSSIEILVQGNFLNFAKNNPIIGVNLLEELLFWTDNRNQPRKINVSDAAALSNYYTTENTISVAKPAPLYPIYLSNIAQGLPLESTMINPSEEFLPDGANNPEYVANWPGDPNFLKDKFIRFSYRYKFDDGEYSLMAPFTQTCFIPRQQGYFIGDDQFETYRSTVVKFVENNVTQIGLNLLLETQSLENDLHVKSIDILYKESDQISVKLVETINVSAVTANMQSNVNKNVYNFVYTSDKPYRTLPQDQTTRVYDQVPVRALAQEVISNRIVYGNFYDKMSPPASLEYGLGYSEKQYNVSSTNPQSQSEYPNHTVKQNRNYQAGIILSDKFGRQSSVILSSKDGGNLDLNVQYGGSTIYVPYYKEAPSTIRDWVGYALRVRFEKSIPAFETIPGYPGLYSETNPLGWYSYKIVVRQQEQDYYNVYLAGILNGYPDRSGVELNETANIVLINDNINKIPRDLSEVGPDQRQYRSSVQLFGRVTPTIADVPNLNRQYYPGTLSDTVVSISTLADTNYNLSGGTDLEYPEFYESITNPLIGRVSTQLEVGQSTAIGRPEQPPNQTYNITLGVYETTPVVSLLDIFWETSSVGLISELNALIDAGFVGPVAINLNGVYSQNEGMALSTKIISGAYVVDNNNVKIITPVNFSFLSVIDGNGIDVKNKFTISKTSNTSNEFDIATNALFYYGSTSNSDIRSRNFTFTINCEDVDANKTVPLQFNGSLENVAPSFTNCPASAVNIGAERFSPWIVYSLTGNNGAAVGLNQTQGLLWSIASVSLNNVLIDNQDVFEISSNGVITNPNGTAVTGSNYQIVVNLQDAGGASASPCNINVSVGDVQATNRVFYLKTQYSDTWNVVWNDGDVNYPQTLTGPQLQGATTNSAAGVPASNQTTVTVSNALGTLQGNTTYRFFAGATQIHSETLNVSDPYIDVSYTFTSVQTGVTYKVEVEYGNVAVPEYYTMSKCNGDGTVSPGFISDQTVSSFNDSLQVPDARVEDSGDRFFFIVTGKTTTPGSNGITDTGELNCPPIVNYYTLEPCIPSSTLLNVVTSETLQSGDSLSMYSTCYKYFQDGTAAGFADPTDLDAIPSHLISFNPCCS